MRLKHRLWLFTNVTFRILFLFILISALGGSSYKKDIISLSDIDPIVLAKNGNELFQYWEMENQKYLLEYETGKINYLNAYRDSINNSIGDSTLNTMIKTEREQLNPRKEINVEDSLNNYDLIHEGYLGEVREINFIEAEILNYQISRFSMFSHPTEFHCFVLENDSLGMIRIYFGASDQKWPPKPKPIISHIEEALYKGWRLTLHLHNHYEPADNNYVGVMAPSRADVHYFKILRNRFNLPEALITNGFSTVALKKNEFDKFNSH